MQHELLDGRRLRFPVGIRHGESIPGIVARGVRRHVLVRTTPVLQAAGVKIRHIGLSQIATHEELERLAFVTRCPPNNLIERAGDRLIERNGPRSYGARFGRLVIPRGYLEFNRRRIGPVTLANDAYHRASWMNLLLPFCPESFERLIDRCNHCDEGLGWFYSQGIGHCDNCRRVVAPSAEPCLPKDLAEDYRMFALLSSPDAQGVEECCAQLPASLSGLAPASLVRLALLVGGLMQPDNVSTSARHRVIRLPAATLAKVVSTGTAALLSWPNGFRSWVAGQAVDLSGSPAALEALRAKMKRLADRNLEADDLVRAVTAAMPDLHGHAAHGFAVDRSYYLYKPVQGMLGITSSRMGALKKWPGIKFLKLNTGAKEQGQFDAEQIDGLVPVFRDSAGTTSCAQWFGLPNYAIEQLCAVGLLEWEDHPGLLATDATSKIRGSSLRRLTAQLIGKSRGVDCKKDLMPADCVSLAVASRRIGGRLKPWASIVEALCAGRIAFWIEGDKPTITAMHVRPSELEAFDTVIDVEAPVGFTKSKTVNQRDAAEILNVTPKSMLALSIDHHCPFVRKGPALAHLLADILAVAEQIVWNAEVALHENVHHRKVGDILMARGIRPLGSGWPRLHLISEKIIPPALAEKISSNCILETTTRFGQL